MGVTPRTTLVDVDPGMAGQSMLAAFGDRARPRVARSAADAVDVVASLAPAAVVVMPTIPTSDEAASDRLAIHRAVVERTRWWCEARMMPSPVHRQCWGC